MSKKLISLLVAAGVFSAIAVGCGSDPAPADDDDTTTTKKDAGKKKTASTDDTGSDNTGTDDTSSPKDSGVSTKDGSVSLPKDSGTTKPPADSGIVTPPADSGVVVPPVDSGTTPVDSGVADSGASADSGVTPPPPACYVKANATGYTPITFPTGHARQAGKCTDAQINAFSATCGTDFAGGTTITNCLTAIDAQPAACAQCVWTSFAAGTTPANTGPLYDDSKYLYKNTGACIDLATKVSGCGTKIVNYFDCALSACNTCTTQADYDKCTDAAVVDACIAKSAIDNTCATAYNANSAAAVACFPPDGSTVASEWTAWFKSASAAFCK